MIKRTQLLCDLQDLGAYRDDERALWRYMSFTKYMELLRTRALYLSRADQSPWLRVLLV